MIRRQPSKERCLSSRERCIFVYGGRVLVVDSVFSMGDGAGYFLFVAGIVIRRSFPFPQLHSPPSGNPFFGGGVYDPGAPSDQSRISRYLRS